MKKTIIAAAVLLGLSNVGHAGDVIEQLKAAIVPVGGVSAQADPKNIAEPSYSPAAGELKGITGPFDGPKITKVENPKYVCQNSGGGYAIAIAGKNSRIWQLNEGSSEGFELGDVVITQKGQPDQLTAEGTLTFFGQVGKLKLTLAPDAGNGGKPSLSASINGDEALKDVPCKVRP